MRAQTELKLVVTRPNKNVKRLSSEQRERRRLLPQFRRLLPRPETRSSRSERSRPQRPLLSHCPPTKTLPMCRRATGISFLMYPPSSYHRLCRSAAYSSPRWLMVRCARDRRRPGVITSLMSLSSRALVRHWICGGKSARHSPAMAPEKFVDVPLTATAQIKPEVLPSISVL